MKINFSIIMPTYNRAFCIENAIDSLLNQSYQNYELIIIDDGSTDDTEQLIKTKYSKELENKKILYKKLAKNKGVCNARNIGLKLAQYDWIGYLDSDNEMLPDFLETFKNAISTNPNNKIFYSQFVRTDGTIVGRCFNYDSLLKGNFIDIGVFIHNKELVKQYGNFDTKLKRLVDWDLIIRYTKKEKPVFIEKVLLNYSNDNDYARISNTESYGNALKKINKKQKNYLKHIFSITNQDIHKVVTLCGIKLKIKSKKLIEKKKNPVLYLTEAEYPAYLKDWFFKKTGQELNLDNPQTFNEKIQWMKLYDSTPIKTRLADKYLVRDWVKEKIGEEYLIPLIGVWEKFEDIDFDKLPDKFVLKANHGSGWNIIVTDKQKFDKEDAKHKFDEWLHTNFAFKAGLELHYKDIKPLIIAEKYIETEDCDLKDYKFLCFNGEVKYVWVDKDRYSDHKRNLYDINWNLLPKKISEGHVYNNFSPCPRPNNYDKMVEFSKFLSKDFPFVRVDFYENNNNLYFGEMTFTSATGTHIFTPESFNLELGKLIELPKNKE